MNRPGKRLLARSKNPRIVGLITARGGSRSVPRKNVAMVGGKPLIAWTIDAALGSGVLDAVIVSTDDPKIATVARRCGAEAPFLRPAELARDETPHLPVVAHALRWLETARGWTPEYLMLLQPTSPLRTSADIRGAVKLAADKKADAVVSVSPARHHPYICVRADRRSRLSPFDPSVPLDLRRQDFPPAYTMNGAIYLVRSRTVLEQKTFYPPRTFAYMMPAERSLDIDEAWELRLAGLMLGTSQ